MMYTPLTSTKYNGSLNYWLISLCKPLTLEYIAIPCISMKSIAHKL